MMVFLVEQAWQLVQLTSGAAYGKQKGSPCKVLGSRRVSTLRHKKKLQ